MQIFDKLDPKGYVILKDKNGNILRANYNTIVNEGKRTLIAKLLHNFISANTVGLVSNQIREEDYNFNFHGICFGGKLDETTVDTVFSNDLSDKGFKKVEYNEYLRDENGNIRIENGSKIKNPLYFTFPSELKDEHTSDHGISEFQINFDEDHSKWYMSITVRVVPATIIETNNVNLAWEENFTNAISSLAIIMKNNNEGTELSNYRLFSRFRFDPIPITSDSEFILTYYIYF